MTRFRHLTLLALGAVVVAACGGSGSSGGAGPRVTRGAITSKAAGSITVNGVEVSTAGAAVRIDDGPGGADDLQLGMVVTVNGTFDDRLGGAAEIEFEDNVRGRIVSVAGGIVSVGGVEVHVDPLTIGSAQVGDRVRVSGVPDDKGGLRATRVDDSPGGAAEDLEVKGFVSSLDTGAKTFRLRLTPDALDADSFLVDYSAISLPTGVADGAYVEVRSAGPAAAGTIVAASMELEDRFAMDAVELEGIVSSGSTSEFVIDGVTVRTDGATRWEHGDPIDLVKGVKVEAEGTLDASGVLHARKVSYRDVVRVTAPVDAVGSGTATVLGIEVILSEFADFGPGLGGSLLGATVQVRGYPTADGKVVALRVDDRTGENRITLQGVAAGKGDADPDHPTFTIMGITVSTGIEFQDIDDHPISARALFSAVEVDRTVLKVRTRSNYDATDVVVNPPSSTLLAKSVELEGSD